MSPRMKTCSIALLLFAAIVSAGRGEDRKTGPTSAAPVRIGGVAYAPSAVTVFQDLCRYLNKHGFAADFVLFSNYDAQVAALDRGEIQIAWNTPLAHAQYDVRSHGASQTLAMRDVDCNVRSTLVARTDS